MANCFKISYSSSSIACRRPALLCNPISIPSNEAKKMASNKSTFIATKHVQNLIKLKKKFLNNLFPYLHIFSSFSWELSIHLRMLSKHLKTGYFQTGKFLLLSQQPRPKDLCEIFSIVHLLVFTSELTM